MLDKFMLFKSFIDNPATRTILTGLSAYCEKDGKNRLEVALELFSGIRDSACWKCRAAEKAIRPILKRGADAFGLTLDDLAKKLGEEEPHWRKGLASVVKGLAYFGVRKPFVSGAPFLIVWDITYACNLRCKHCYASAGRPLENELTTQEAKNVIDRLDRWGVAIIAFSGGEPLVRPDIFELTRYAKSKGFYVAMASNGTLIDRDMARRMKENGVNYVQISLDGMKDTHEKFRGLEGIWEKTVDGIKNCVKEGLFVNVSTCVTRYNYDEVPEIISLCEKLGVNWWMHYNFIPTGRGKEIVETDLSPQQREELLKMIYERNKNSPINLLSTAPQYARVALQCEMGTFIPTHFYNIEAKGGDENILKLAELIGGCGAGRFYMAFKANGDIQPCVFFPLKLGNLRDTDLEDLWIHNKALNEMRNKDLIEGCKDCPFRYYCGGCRARAYNYFGDYLKPDPGCINNEKYWEELKQGLYVKK